MIDTAKRYTAEQVHELRDVAEFVEVTLMQDEDRWWMVSRVLTSGTAQDGRSAAYIDKLFGDLR